jgi:hypothetical protein
MARGWESKSVEAQQAEADAQKSPPPPRLTSEQMRRKKEFEGLDLSRRQVLQQLTQARDPRHQDMLRQALADLEARIRELSGEP